MPVTSTTADTSGTISSEIVPSRLTARERLLIAADELFYEEGVHTVGIDRVIERAGVAKASLYNTFGSKDELVRAYLTRRYDQRKARMTLGLQRFATPTEKVLGVFDLLGESIAMPTYRGCAFVNASAESLPGEPAEFVSDEIRGWMRTLFTTLLTEAGVTDPESLTQQLVLLYDGAAVSARMDHNKQSAQSARTVAAMLLDAAVLPNASGDGGPA